MESSFSAPWLGSYVGFAGRRTNFCSPYAVQVGTFHRDLATTLDRDGFAFDLSRFTHRSFAHAISPDGESHK